MASQEPNRALGIVSGAVLLIALSPVGLLIGGFVASRIGSKSQMGWDQLADTLGGAMLGVLGAWVAGIVLIQILTPRKRFVVALVATASIVALIVILRIVRPLPPAVETPPVPKREVTAPAEPAPEREPSAPAEPVPVAEPVSNAPDG